jgi:hypothetical protein
MLPQRVASGANAADGKVSRRSKTRRTIIVLPLLLSGLADRGRSRRNPMMHSNHYDPLNQKSSGEIAASHAHVRRRQVRGLDEADPVASDDPPQDRAQDRRVERTRGRSRRMSRAAGGCA